MQISTVLKRPHRVLSLGIAFTMAGIAVSSSDAVAGPITNWTLSNGTIASNLSTSSPILGNNTSESADNQAIWATTGTAFSLNAVGDMVSLSGGVAFQGLASPQADQFRFGLYSVNGQSTINGWLGYFASNSGTSGGPTYSRLWERNNPNTNSYGSGTGATTIANVNATPSNTGFLSGNYTFSLTYTRVATGLKIDWTLLGTNVTYSVSGSFVDTTPQTYTFDRVGIFTGSGLNANQASFSNIAVNYTPVPEPAAVGILLGSSLLFLMRRHRRA